jgi:hypothetical protein
MKYILLIFTMASVAARADMPPFDVLAQEFHSETRKTSPEEVKGYYLGRCFAEIDSWRPLPFAFKSVTRITETKHPAVIVDNGPLFPSPAPVPAHSTFYSREVLGAALVKEADNPSLYDGAPANRISWDLVNGASAHYSFQDGYKDTLEITEDDYLVMRFKKISDHLVFWVAYGSYDPALYMCYGDKVQDLPPERVIEN